jgi:hypothetical protein
MIHADMETHDRELITVTMLNHRKGERVLSIERLYGFRAEARALTTEIRAELRAMTSDLVRHIYITVAAQMALLLGIAYFFSLHVK